MATNVAVHPHIVRAWFDTVLNPLIRGLATEAAVLAERNLTWRIQPQRLASLVPVREHLVVEAWDNYEQFLSLHAEFVAPIEEHDRCLDRLSASCRRLDAALIGSQALQQAFEHAKLALPPGGNIQDYFGAFDPQDYLKVIAVYIINDVQRLPIYYTTAPIWNAHRDAFVAVRETGEVRPFWQATMEAANQLSAAVNTLRDKLKTLRNELSLSHGVPIVDRLSGAV